ncbi:MAG: hypothetical protein KBT11_11445 [Treponema sp.]|nr:hypothetical protein [Candidatus Treponema equifaecale]
MNFRAIFSVLLVSFFSSQGFSFELPEQLSEDSKISLVNIEYNSTFKSPFSKSCLRIYDKNLGLDQLVDFAHFENFEDNFFLLKFYFRNKQASICSYPYTKIITGQNDASISDSLLDLTYPEREYIYDFVYKLLTAFPEYKYDFDILENNAYTHISSILNDCKRKFNTTNRSFVSDSRNITSKALSSSTDSVPLELYSSKINGLDLPDYKLSFISYNKLLIVSLIFLLILYLIESVYQSLVIFKISYYRSSVYKLINSFDFALFFLSGILGSIFFLQDIFSNQSIFRNNYQFLIFLPTNLLMAFEIFFPSKKTKWKKVYWFAAGSLILVYFPFYIFIQKEVPFIQILMSLPILFRAVYFILYDSFRKTIVKQWLKLPEQI